MNSPRRPDGPAIYDGKPYSAAVHLRRRRQAVRRHRQRPARARLLGARDPARRSRLRLPDHRGFWRRGYDRRRSAAPIPECYEAATDMLAALHREDLPETLPLAPQLTYAIPVFDVDAWLVEIGLMTEWYLPDRGAELSREQREQFIAMWRELLAKPAAAPRTWVMRDFIRPTSSGSVERNGILRVGIIDFQDAVLGPAAYDMVSLLQDARIDVPEQLELTLLTRYIKARRVADPDFDPRLRRTLRHHVGAAEHPPARHLRPAQPARRKAAISAPPAPDLDLSEPLAGPARRWRLFANGMRRTCRRRVPDLPVVSHLPLSWQRLCSAFGQPSWKRKIRPWHRRTRKGDRVTFERGICRAHDGHRRHLAARLT